MRRIILTLILLVSLSSAAYAGPEVDRLLNAIDGIPTDRRDLERQLPDAQAALIAAAQDPSRSDYQRLRAIAFLSFYPDDVTLTALGSLLQSKAIEIRRAAVYTLGRTTWTGNAKVAERVADVAESDPAPEVREHAVRALRWVDEPAAATRLERIAIKRPELAPLARETLARRAKR